MISNKIFNFFSSYKYRLRKEFLKSGEVEFDKQEFHSSKRTVCMHDVNTDKIIFFFTGFPVQLSILPIFSITKLMRKFHH